MNAFEKNIQQIRQIRSLRVQSKVRKQAKCAQELQLLDANIEKAQRNIQHEKQQAITFQRDGLARLLAGSLVGVDSLKEFNSQKLSGIKKVANAQQEALEIGHSREAVLQKLALCNAATKEAEKRLIGIEEVIEKELWK